MTTLERIVQAGIAKAKQGTQSTFILAILAGFFIGLGAVFATLVLSDASLSFAVSRVMAGSVFCVGLVLVLVAGARLFTGDCLMIIPAVTGQIRARAMVRSWVIVILGNAVGAAILAALIVGSGQLDMNAGKVAATAASIAAAKVSLPFAVAFYKGVLCNILVCLAVWMASAGETVTDKIVALVGPITLFVAAGFEHSVANFYFLAVGWQLGAVTLTGAVHNLVPVLLGNLVGGVAVGLAYYRSGK